MNRVVHFEVPVADVDKAKEFYQKVLAWNIKTREGSWGSMTTIETGAKSETGIDGSFFKKSTVPPEFHRVINIIEVDDIDSMIVRIKAHGGKIVFGPIQYADIGTMVYFQDTEDNILGILAR